MSSLKKASLSLSINAVVILVLAIAMLGLGLGFTKKMFSKFGDTLAIPEPELTASESDPIVMISDQIEIKKNKDISLPVKYYSSGGSTYGSGVAPYLHCPATGSQSEIGIKGAFQPVGQGEQKTFRLIIPKNNFNETTICTMYIIDGALPTVPNAPSASIADSKQVSILPSG